MRGAFEVVGNAAAGHILAQRQGQRRGGAAEAVGRQHLGQRNALALGVGHLDAHAGFAGHGFNDPDRLHAHAAGQIVLDIHDRGAAHALPGLNLETGDDRPRDRPRDKARGAVLGQFALDDPRQGVDVETLGVGLALKGRMKQRQIGQLIRPGRGARFALALRIGSGAQSGNRRRRRSGGGSGGGGGNGGEAAILGRAQRAPGLGLGRAERSGRAGLGARSFRKRRKTRGRNGGRRDRGGLRAPGARSRFHARNHSPSVRPARKDFRIMRIKPIERRRGARRGERRRARRGVRMRTLETRTRLGAPTRRQRPIRPLRLARAPLRRRHAPARALRHGRCARAQARTRRGANGALFRPIGLIGGILVGRHGQAGLVRTEPNNGETRALRARARILRLRRERNGRRRGTGRNAGAIEAGARGRNPFGRRSGFSRRPAPNARRQRRRIGEGGRAGARRRRRVGA